MMTQMKAKTMRRPSQPQVGGGGSCVSESQDVDNRRIFGLKSSEI